MSKDIRYVRDPFSKTSVSRITTEKTTVVMKTIDQGVTIWCCGVTPHGDGLRKLTGRELSSKSVNAEEFYDALEEMLRFILEERVTK